jgi:ketosteroid isomerase-like protein
VDVVLRLFDAFNRADADSVRELWADDGEWRPAYVGGGLVEGAVYRGRDGIVEFIALQAETWESITATPIDVRDLGDRVLVEVRLEAVGRASGLAVDQPTWNVFELRDGQAAAGTVYTTRADALAAVGLPE